MKRVCMIPIHTGTARRLRRMSHCRSIAVVRIASRAIEDYLDITDNDRRHK